jgi:ParB family transcriptional regulator, chromosome partitioning protein
MAQREMRETMAIPAEKIDGEKVTEKAVEKRRALGRGLESLLPSGPRVVTGPVSGPVEVRGQGPAATAGEGAGVTVAAMAEPGVVDLQAMAAGRGVEGHPVLEIPIEQVDDNPYQTRSDFDSEILHELARSIQTQGVLQPIAVRPGEGGRYILILGERRLRASKLAGKATIPAIVRRVSAQQAAEMTIVENLQRQDLDCLEQAQAFANLSTGFDLTQEEIGKRVGASRETVSNYLRLLKLPTDVQNFISRGDLTYSHARELLVLKDDSQISKLAHLAVRKRMSVLQLEDAVMDVDIPKGPQPPESGKGGGARWVDPNVRAAQRTLETILGMRVRIRDRRGKGKITIEYGTLEDFDRVVGMLKGK